MLIKDAGVDSVPGITEIYNHAVQHSTAVWNEQLVDEADRSLWLTGRQKAGYPVLVAVENDTVLGYATFGEWRSWEGYRHTVEHSVYVRDDQRGKGIGKALMVELINRAEKLGKHVMVAGIEAGNIGSIRLHERLGFEHAGLLKQVGAKFGSWLDLAFMQLTLDRRTEP